MVPAEPACNRGLYKNRESTRETGSLTYMVRMIMMLLSCSKDVDLVFNSIVAKSREEMKAKEIKK